MYTYEKGGWEEKIERINDWNMRRKIGMRGGGCYNELDRVLPGPEDLSSLSVYYSRYFHVLFFPTKDRKWL